MTTSSFPVGPPSRRRGAALARLVRNPLGVVSILVLAVFALAATFAPALTSVDPNFSSVRDAMLPAFSDGHPLGTDSAGRDVWARLLYGARISLMGALLALAVAAAIGIPGGLLAGYYGRAFDAGAIWASNLIQSVPGIVVLLAARAVLGPSIWISMFIYGIVLSPGFFRVTRAAVINVRDELYIDAAKVAGLGDRAIIARHILTVIRAPIIIQAALLLGVALAIQSGLEFLGVGDNATPSWGNLLNEGFKNVYRDPLSLVWPTLAIGLTCAALVLLANAVRDALEDRSGQPTRPPRRWVDSVSTRPAAGSTGMETAPEDDGSLLRLRDLSVAYGYGDAEVTVVDGVGLSVRRGEVLGLVGESGSGKTQTAFAALGLLSEGGRVVGGSITFEGRELVGLSDRERRAIRGTGIGYVPQEPMSNLDPSFRVGTQLMVPLRRRLGLNRTKSRRTALELLDRVGIVDPLRVMNAYPHEISGGMAQRVLIAAAVSCRPKLLIADEPTTALDVTVQAEVLELIRDLTKEFRMGVILVTHNFGVVADLCDHIAVMQSGRIVEQSEALPTFDSPQHEYTRMLLNSTLEGGPSRLELDLEWKKGEA